MPVAIGVALATPCTALDVQASRPASGILSNNRSARTTLKVSFSQSPCKIRCARLAVRNLTRGSYLGDSRVSGDIPSLGQSFGVMSHIDNCASD